MNGSSLNPKPAATASASVTKEKHDEHAGHAVAAGSGLNEHAQGNKEAVDVFRCDFSEEYDKNYDSWPDGWSRRRGIGYPTFLPVAIVDADTRPALRMQLDGGAASIYSPQIPVSPLFSYRLDGVVKTAGLQHDIACYSLTFFDADGRVLEKHESLAVTRADDWTPLRIGPIVAANPDTYTAVIGLHLRPRSGEGSDLRGTAMFDELRLARLPRVVLRANQKLHLYDAPDAVEVSCEVSGVLEPNPVVTFVLEDLRGRVLAKHAMPLAAAATASGHTLAPAKHGAKQHHGHGHDDHHGKHDLAHHDEPAQVRGFAGEAKWKPPIKEFGFYRVRAELADAEASRIERSISVAIARPMTAAEQGEFGWSLPQGDARLDLKELPALVGNVGIHWLKFPMWFSEHDTARPDRLAWFADRVSMQHIQLIGVLDQPPPTLRKLFGGADVPVATLFVEAPLWQPAIDPVMTRLSLKVRWWQLGGDGDTSFVGFTDLPAKIDEIKKHFLKFGQEVRVGLVWPWLTEPALGAGDFLARTGAPPLTAAETAAYLRGDVNRSAAKWLTLEPLDRNHYDLDTRARDLVERMLSAKIQRADAAFLPDPFDPRYGVLQADGTPDELLLPWRTTALLLGGAEYLGALHLPGGSTNHIFRRGQEAVMVIWNRQGAEETLYLGEQIEHFDLWGARLPHETSAASGANEQTLHVQSLPTFVTGLSLPVARLRLSLAFEQSNLASVFGRDQLAKYSFQNTFGQGVGGEVRISSPPQWEINPLITSFRAAENETARAQFDVRFKAEAQSGPQLLRLDFKLTADRDYAFSAYQPLNVGIGDVSIETTTQLSDAGELVVEQTFINQTDQFISFNCLLFAPGRRRERVQVMNLGRGRHTATYVLPQGAELLGQTLLLRAEEIEGERVLNYRIVPQE